MRPFPLLVVVALSSTAHASVLYTFTYTPNTGPVQGFSFSFSAPTFITTPGPFPFIPFSYTDGTNTWTMVQSRAGNTGVAGIDCFYFVTAQNATLGDCTSTIFPPDSGSFVIGLMNGFPTQTGTYSSTYGFGSPYLITFDSARYVGFLAVTDDFAHDTGVGTLVITDDTVVPEPGTAVLIGAALAGIASVSTARRLGRPR
jgi:hypothetical protein